ncbi:hypothetical protein D4R75_12845 [bacterium]|nr:MAG: hypothetical protein D4R75_12845 [bacterium]
MSNICAGGASASGGEHRIMNDEVLMASEKELENLFNGLILRLVPSKRDGTRSGQVQRAFRGDLVQ